MDGSCTSCSLGALTSALDQQEFGAQVVSKTMDTMNHLQAQGSNGGDQAGYQFQQAVLGAYAGIGANINVTV